MATSNRTRLSVLREGRALNALTQKEKTELFHLEEAIMVEEELFTVVITLTDCNEDDVAALNQLMHDSDYHFNFKSTPQQ
jgi:hypothetical protein